MAIGQLLALVALFGAMFGAVGLVEARSGWCLALACAGLAFLPAERRWRQTCVAVALGAALSGHAASQRERALAPPVAVWLRGVLPTDQTSHVTRITGRLAEDAALGAEGSVRLTVDVSEIGLGVDRVRTSGRVRLHVAGTLAEEARGGWTRGRRIEAPVALRWPAFIRNPGSPSIEWQALTRGYALAGTIKSAALVDVQAGRWVDEIAASARRRVRRAAAALFVGEPVARDITTAILIGDRTGLDPETEGRLLEAGTYHVLAISGGNIAILTTLVFAGMGLIVRSPRHAAGASLFTVAGYGWIVMGEPSVARAVLGATVWLLSRASGLDSRPLNVLSTVAMLMLAVDPLVVVDAGAWLSFGATLGILTLAEPCARVIGGQSGPAGGPPKTNLLLGVLAASLAVQIALIPVTALVFGRLGLAAPLLNLIAIPAMSVVQIAGMMAVLLWTSVPDAAHLIAPLAVWGTQAIVDSPTLLSWVPWLGSRVPPPPWVWVVLFYAAALTSVIASGRSWRRGALLTTALLVSFLPAIATTAGRPRSGWLRVTFLDVGQGDATVIQFPGGRALLLDGGNRTASFDTGERVVAPALWALAIRRLEWAAMSHADRDHSGGLPGIVALFRPREIWEGLPVPGDSARAELRSAGRLVDAGWRELRRGDRLEVDGVAVEVLHPPVPDWERRRVRNDDSLVVRVRWQELDLLLAGDVSQVVERELARDIADREVGAIRVLKVAHHGSRTSTAPELLRAWAPWIGIVSTGRNNPFGHPSPDVVDRLRAAGAHVIRTDRDGATTIESDGRTARVSTWTGRLHLQAFGAVRRP